MTEANRTEHDMPRAYQPSDVETRWYRFWLENGYFKAKIDPQRKPFVIIMPPPNVTGELHIGHALTATLEDIMTRWHRMMGESTLWLPGFDHAGIAAQVIVEKALAREGLNRQQMGRQAFFEKMQQWADQCRHTISEQHQRLGISCDWSREQFTMDNGPSRAVRTTFVNLYEKGLIYRGERIINWCPRCSTAISDLEVDHKDIEGKLYYVNYPLAADNRRFITVATTRPETILGDTAVAVNPDDERYKDLTGEMVVLPSVNREIPIIADDAVDTSFGTGAVKITPSHDPVDFEVSQRKGLPRINIINPDATMNENAGAFSGLDRFNCREAILSYLSEHGLLARVEPYSHSVGHCHRCQTVIEPLCSKQWFVKTEPLARPAINAVKNGDIRIIPEHFTKVYLNWMENIRDWCISRQLWWGHRIPVWYCQECSALTVDTKPVTRCRYCNSTRIEQDPDVLDTWFSSALWTHSTLGWPDDTADLGYFYPTSVMETGYDILFFWVARMIMMGLENTGNIPFHTVYLHGLVRDKKGEKMSKVRGNVINPLSTIEKYGTDALRFALSTNTAPGNDIKLTPARLEAGRNFANKLWNATRFIVRSCDSKNSDYRLETNQLTMEDRWILSRLNHTIASVTKTMDGFQFGEAQRYIHDFLWGEFCDWYIEIAKVRMSSPGETNSPLPILLRVMESSLRLLHPFMPFLTEELWQHIRDRLSPSQRNTQSIMIAPYPQADTCLYDSESERIMSSVTEIVRAIRNTRSEYGIDSNRLIEVRIYAGKLVPYMKLHSDTIQSLARTRPLNFYGSRKEKPPRSGEQVLVLQETEVVISLEGIVDFQAERARLQRQIEETRSALSILGKRLQDKSFLTKAPQKIIDNEREKLLLREFKLKRLEERLDSLNPGKIK
ncbi:MAG: valine--tRNA ligase [Dehalococcoidales bacterium]